MKAYKHIKLKYVKLHDELYVSSTSVVLCSSSSSVFQTGVEKAKRKELGKINAGQSIY